MRLKKRFLWPFFVRVCVVYFLMAVSAYSLATDHSNNIVNVATASLPPYTEAEGGGILNVIVREAFSAVDKKVKFHDVPWERAKLYVARGVMDAALPLSHGDIQRLSNSGSGSGELVLKTPSLLLVSRKDSNILWNGHFDSIFDKSIVVMRGYSYMKGLDDEVKIKKIYVDSTDQQVDLLLRGRAKLALMDQVMVNYYFRKSIVSDNLKVLSPPLQINSEFYLGVGGSQGKGVLRSFKKGMEKINANGKIKEIIDEFGYSDTSETPDQQYLMEGGQYEVSSTKVFKGSNVRPLKIKLNKNTMHFGLAGFFWDTDSYQRVYREAFIEASELYGIKITEYDAQGSIDNQKRQIRELIKNKVDVIILWPTHSKDLLPVLEEAKAASIPVVLTNTSIDLSGLYLIRAYAGPNSFMEGRLAARMMVEALKGKGRVVEIQGFPGYATAQERSLGFEYELNKQREERPEIEIKIIDSVSGYWSREKAKAAAERLLSRQQDFDGVYAADDNMAIGAIEAFNENNKSGSLFITSATLFGEGYDLIKQGVIYGSVRQSPREDARTALNVAIKIARGEEVPFYNFINLKAVTLENIETVDRPEF